MATLSSSNSTIQPARQGTKTRGRSFIAAACRAASSEAADSCSGVTASSSGRRQVLQGLAVAVALGLAPAALAASDFVRTQSGLLIQDITEGQGRQPQPGDRCVVHWAGYTKNYQAKRLDNTSARDEPYEFILGGSEAIPAFEEAVSSMRVGGIRRIEVLGELPQLSYPRDRSERFVSGFKYRFGPQPFELGGQRALDFILDNQTLSPTNRTLLFDIKLLSVYGNK